MTNEEILKKAIEKAIANGWTHEHLELRNGEIRFWDSGLGEWGGYYDPSSYEIIFSHSFAKAFWGFEEYKSCEELGHPLRDEDGERNHIPGVHKVNDGWQHHLKQMVLESDPIQYLAKFI